MAKSKKTLCICVLLGIIVTLFVIYQIHEQRTMYEVEEFYYPSYDLPAVEESDSAYLLNPNFSINADNFSDCLHDYFAAPSILYYTFVLSDHDETLLIQNERTVDFADAFCNVSMTQLLESYPLPLRDKIDDYYSFENAIGRIQIWEEQEDTYILFTRMNDFVQDESCFSISGQSLVPQLERIATSLKDVSEEPPKNIDPLD
ncbi:MAG: hypothetical protein ACOX7K_08285 [Oscillospiraceae bacterium]|jgi:hypothetical protein